MENQVFVNSAKKLKKSPPWYAYVNELQLMFGQDPDITINFYDDDELEVKLYVKNEKKASALTAILPVAKDFGGKILKVTVVPDNELDEFNYSKFLDAFDGNPIFEYAKDGQLFGKPIGYVVFKNEVVQYFDDNLGDIHGNVSTLYQNIAKDIFEGKDDGIFFCTATPEESDEE